MRREDQSKARDCILFEVAEIEKGGEMRRKGGNVKWRAGMRGTWTHSGHIRGRSGEVISIGGGREGGGKSCSLNKNWKSG